MTEKLQLLMLETADDNRREQLIQRVRDYNDSVSEWHSHIRQDGALPLDIYAYDEQGTLIGGLVADTYWQWLAVDYLWVAEEHRRNGLGSLLLLEAETKAMARQCRWVKLSTFGFQAPEFYFQLGYQQVGELTDYPPGNRMIWLRKELLRNEQTIG